MESQVWERPQVAVTEYRESHVTQCARHCRCYRPHPMTDGYHSRGAQGHIYSHKERLSFRKQCAK